MRNKQKMFNILVGLFMLLVMGSVSAECDHIIEWEYFETYVPSQENPAMHECLYYRVDKCKICSYVYEHEPDTYEEYHYFLDENGICSKCQYQEEPVCSHENIGYGGEGYFIEPSVAFTATQHYVINVYEICCSDCGKFLREEENGYWEKHYFDHKYNNGYCICGCPDPDVPLLPLTVTGHTSQNEIKIGELFAYSYRIEGGSGRFEKEWYVYSDTGLFVHDVWPLKAEKPGNWIVRLTVKDTVTGEMITVQSDSIEVLKDCIHQNIKPKHILSTVDRETPITETQHYVFQETQWYCTDCGEFLETCIEGLWENHSYGHDSACICGVRSSEILEIYLSVTDAEVCIGETFGVEAICSGGSGQYDLEWMAKSSMGHSVPGHYSITAQEPDLWYFELILTDTVTGETAKAQSNAIIVNDHVFDCPEDSTEREIMENDNTYCVNCGLEIIPVTAEQDNSELTPDAAKERYSIYVDDPYFYPQHDMIVLCEGTAAHLKVYDNLTEQVLFVEQVEHLDFEQLEETSYGILTDHDVFHVFKKYHGYYNIALTYDGVEIDRISVHCSFHDNRKLSEQVRLDTMKCFNWKKEGMRISKDLQIFDFTAQQKNDKLQTYPDGYYKVSMEVFNISPAIYGVLVYDANDNLISTSYINSYWREFSVSGVVEYVYFGFVDFWDFRAGNTESYACKTIINIDVPAGGYIRFADPLVTDELAMANYINGAVSLLSSKDSLESLVDVIGINDKAALRKAMKELDWQDLVSSITIFYRQATTREMRNEAIKAVLEGGWEAIILDKELMSSISSALQKSFFSMGVNELVDYGMLAFNVGVYYSVHGADAILQSIELTNLWNILANSNQGNQMVKMKYVFFPHSD